MNFIIFHFHMIINFRFIRDYDNRIHILCSKWKPFALTHFLFHLWILTFHILWNVSSWKLSIECDLCNHNSYWNVNLLSWDNELLWNSPVRLPIFAFFKFYKSQLFSRNIPCIANLKNALLLPWNTERVQKDKVFYSLEKCFYNISKISKSLFKT